MTRREIVRRGSALTLAGLIVAAGSAFVTGDDPRVMQPEPAAAVATPVAAVVTPPPTVVEAVAAVADTAEEVSKLVRIDEDERARLATEMSRWVTRNPHQLVDVIADLAEKQPLPLPPTFLLSIAWSETRGKILAISPAGAAGLAQATPSAYLSEGLDGKVFVTNDYLMG